jgi:hypothetical protein
MYHNERKMMERIQRYLQAQYEAEQVVLASKGEEYKRPPSVSEPRFKAMIASYRKNGLPVGYQEP